jgi:4-amino-4-deoxy-L-arabinose transferase-like glycosyltransferase
VLTESRRKSHLYIQSIPGGPSARVYPLLIALLGIVFFFPFLGSVHLFDWDEINFAESAREMLVTGNYAQVQIDFQPFWEKPPLFFWMQALSMHVFGVNEFAARFPNAVFGVITLLTLYYVGKKLYSPVFGLLWALAHFGAFLPHLYFKSGIIDPVFNYFMFVGLYFLALTVASYQKPGATRNAILSGLFVGLAILTKGPVALLIVGLCFLVFWISTGFKAAGSFKNILLFALAAFMVSFLWFGPETIQNGPTFIKGFIEFQISLFTTPVAGHGQPFWYHFVVVFIGCFPISILALRGFVYKAPSDNMFRRWMIILFWVVMILFSISTSKVVHYSSMAYYGVSFLAAYYIFYLLQQKVKFTKVTATLLYGIGGLLSLLLAALPVVGMYAHKITPYIKDKFAVANLQAQVHWGGWEAVIGILYFVAIVVAVQAYRKQNVMRASVLLFVATGLCLFTYSAIVVPKIEGYSQAASIRFFKSLQGKDVYVDVVGFRSFAHLFYFDKQPPANQLSYDKEWLLHGYIDKPAYFVTRVDRAAPFLEMPHLQVIGEENGFIFFRREQGSVGSVQTGEEAAAPGMPDEEQGPDTAEEQPVADGVQLPGE